MDNYNQNEHGHAGLIAGIIAYTLWGFLPVFFKLTHAVPALEILAHRIVWAVPFGLIIILIRKQGREVTRAFRNPKTLGYLTLAALLIALNWGVYIWAVQKGHIFQASLGYYITPLLFVLIGVAFLGENLRKLQIFAVVLASIGVATLTIFGGKFPWISLTLAVSFTIYGFIRKKIAIGAMPGLFVETIVLLLPALSYMIWLNTQNDLVFAHTGWGLNTLMILAGPITVIPLVAFAFAARRLRLSTIGFLQFIGPSLSFMIGIYYGEKLTLAYILCFAFIWSAVALFAWDAVRQKKN
ncbi:MAG: EamA family transporter RarD [Robiginitomaculum sp.]